MMKVEMYNPREIREDCILCWNAWYLVGAPDKILCEDL